jgi:hypothetical protein
LATSTNDILDELDYQLKIDREVMEKVMPDGPQEIELIRILEAEPLHLDEPVRISGSKTSEISARLSIMETKRMIRNIWNGIYKNMNWRLVANL